VARGGDTSGTIERKLATLRGKPTLSEIRDALRAPVGLLVAAAAKCVADDHPTLFEEFGAAFDRLCDKGAQRDPGCRGKLALLSALYDLDRWDAAFDRGVRYVQAEPQWGGSVDTAAQLRGLCGMALAHFLRSDALDVLGELLADPERATRVAAAQALGNAGRADATALLRFKLLSGDAEPLVQSACFESLLVLAKDDALPFVGRFLARDGETAEVAVLALGASHLAGAQALIAAWSARVLPEPRRRVGYLALALLRIDAATEELLALVSSGSAPDATSAAAALTTFKDDPTLRERIVKATREQRDRGVREAILKKLA